MALFVGTSGYSYKEWKGAFYPDKLPANQMLRFYGERFRTVEINNSFYRLPTAEVVAGWAAVVPADFRFVLKAPQQITHIQRLKGSDDTVEAFYKVAATLSDRLGPLLFQLPPNMKKDFDRLRAFLSALPAGPRVAFEFRHPSWFDDESLGLLREHKVALCVAEADDGPEVPVTSTADWGYLRLRRADYTDAELAEWVRRVKEHRWSDVFVFFKHEDAGNAPRLAVRFRELYEESS